MGLRPVRARKPLVCLKSGQLKVGVAARAAPSSDGVAERLKLRPHPAMGFAAAAKYFSLDVLARPLRKGVK